jgi:hypothetical protein
MSSEVSVDMEKEPIDDDRKRFAQMGITQESLDPGKKKVFYALASVVTLVFLSGIFYTVFFYVTLPNHHTLSRPGQPQVDSVPLPVPPSTMFPGVGGASKSILTDENRYFIASVGDLLPEGEGLSLVLTLHIKTTLDGSGGISLILSTPPRWVDGNQGSMEGSLSWDKSRLLKPGETVTFPIHFVKKPRTAKFDLYIGFLGNEGMSKKRYPIHFSGLKLPS